MKTFKEFSKINENHNFTNESANTLKGVKEYRDGLTPETVMKDFRWLLKAKFKDGVLTMEVPKKEAQPKVEETKRIAIEG